MVQVEKVSQTYDLWSKFYDHTFKPIVIQRQREAIAQLRLRPGDRVLDLGVGTGMSLGFFPNNIHLVGLDLSGGMLRQARKKVRKNGHSHVDLVQGDALRPPFADQSFDHAFISHVISVVPRPRELLRQVARLVKPNGRVVIINHFQSPRRLIGMLEKLINPICLRLGWRSDLSVSDLLKDCPLELAYQCKLNSIDLWHIVVLTAGSSSVIPPDEALPCLPPLAAGY